MFYDVTEEGRTSAGPFLHGPTTIRLDRIRAVRQIDQEVGRSATFVGYYFVIDVEHGNYRVMRQTLKEAEEARVNLLQLWKARVAEQDSLQQRQG